VTKEKRETIKRKKNERRADSNLKLKKINKK
jgi:hypothetical protein